MSAALEARAPTAALSRKSAVALVAIGCVAFSTSAPLARFARPAHPLTIAFGRVAIAALVLLAPDLRGAATSIRAMTLRQLGIVVGAGVLLAAHFALFQWGLDRTSLPAAVSLVALEPLGVVLCAWAIHGLVPRPRERAGVLLATLGAFIVARGVGAGEHRLFGDALVVGAVALYGFYVTAARSLRDVLPAVRYAGLVYACATIALAPVVVFVPGAAAAPPPHALVAIAAMGVIPTALGHTAVQSAARRISPSIVALVSPGETIGAIALGAAALGTIPTSTELAGAAVIACGSILAIRATTSKREAVVERAREA